jgi:hypothetical protein
MDPQNRDHARVFLRSIGLHGVFVGAHAISEGALTLRQLREGPYVRVLRGVYADPSLPRDHLLRCRAAALLMPERAALGARSAAAVLGAPAPTYIDPVTVVVPAGDQWRGPAGVRVHRAPLPREDVLESEDGLRHTTALRTAWDIGALERTPTAVGVLDALLRSGHLEPVHLQQVLRTAAGRWGARRVRRAFELADARSESPPESWLRVACVLGGLPVPVPQYDVVEREYHFEGLQIARDDVRYRRLEAAGWRVIRLSAADLRDLEVVVRRIEDALTRVPAVD